MKTRRCFGLLFLFLTACQPSVALPQVTADVGDVFTLAPGQSATIEAAGLTLTLTGVPGDERCPLEIECTESGPVTVAVTVQSGSNAPGDFTFHTFTDNDGSIPEMDFEGMTASIEADGFVVRLKSVLPFPRMSFAEIEDGEYRVSFVVSQSEK